MYLITLRMMMIAYRLDYVSKLKLAPKTRDMRKELSWKKKSVRFMKKYYEADMLKDSGGYLPIIGDDNICPITKEPCLDECCSPGSVCNLNSEKENVSIFMNVSDGKPVVNEVFADNGEHSHWELIDPRNGKILWTEEETEENKKLSDDLKDFCDRKGYTSKPLQTVMPMILEYLEYKYRILIK